VEPAFTSARDLRVLAPGEIPILMYHHVSVAPASSRHAYLHVSPRAFARQMADLLDSGFHARSLDFAAEPPAAREIVLTFDDGLENVFRHALPELIDARQSAIQFLVSDLLGKWNVWDENSGAAQARLMEESQVREWLAAGNEIGAHTRTHPHLTQLSLAAAREEIFGSRRKLEDTFGCAITHFCYPYGDWNEAVRDLVREAGFTSACSVRPALANVADDPFTRPRLLAKQPKPTSFFSRFKAHAVRVLT
jgi:peptidoglycan/xylan/chitin deacetylase (PgdA/CDA1 family)